MSFFESYNLNPVFLNWSRSSILFVNDAHVLHLFSAAAQKPFAEDTRHSSPHDTELNKRFWIPNHDRSSDQGAVLLAIRSCERALILSSILH